jgi:hypothetical protein
MTNPPETTQEAGRNGRGDGAPVRSELLREVNARIREVGREGTESVNGLEFVCECGDGDCVSMVELTTLEYDDIRLERGLVLATGHRPVAA